MKKQTLVMKCQLFRVEQLKLLSIMKSNRKSQVLFSLAVVSTITSNLIQSNTTFFLFSLDFHLKSHSGFTFTFLLSPVQKPFGSTLHKREPVVVEEPIYFQEKCASAICLSVKSMSFK